MTTRRGGAAEGGPRSLLQLALEGLRTGLAPTSGKVVAEFQSDNGFGGSSLTTQPRSRLKLKKRRSFFLAALRLPASGGRVAERSIVTFYHKDDATKAGLAGRFLRCYALGRYFVLEARKPCAVASFSHM
ncbi:MAG: hypothetical protein ACM3JD_09310 [Rudaea sp.]